MKKSELIGNTPLIRINYLFDGKKRHLFAKLEFYNPTGSIKDRLVNYVLLNENLKIGTPLVEATSGNTGIALASYGARKKMPVTIFMPDFVSKERVQLLKLFGADVVLVSHEEGGFKTAVKKAYDFALSNNGYLFNQFSNIQNVRCHYNTTGVEIVNSLGSVHKFVSGIGTGGTLMGTGTRLKECFGSQIVAIEPDTLPILKDKEAEGTHKINGIGDDFIPDIVDMSKIDSIIDVNDEDAINMSFKLAQQLGLGVGISSGANFIGCALATNDDNENVVTVFPDDNKKYLSMFDNKPPVNSDFVSNKIELIDYEIVD